MASIRIQPLLSQRERIRFNDLATYNTSPAHCGSVYRYVTQALDERKHFRLSQSSFIRQGLFLYYHHHSSKVTHKCLLFILPLAFFSLCYRACRASVVKTLALLFTHQIAMNNPADIHLTRHFLDTNQQMTLITANLRPWATQMWSYVIPYGVISLCSSFISGLYTPA